MGQSLLPLLRPVIEAMGYDLWGFEYQPRRGNALLRLYIDHPQGITLDDCTRVSRQVSAVLDVDDPIPGQYTLEISSPGLDRLLFEPKQYAAYCGQQVRLLLNTPVAGSRKLLGRLEAVTADQVLVTQDQQQLSIPFSHIDRARLVPDFNAPTHAPKGVNLDE